MFVECKSFARQFSSCCSDALLRLRCCNLSWKNGFRDVSKFRTYNHQVIEYKVWSKVYKVSVKSIQSVLCLCTVCCVCLLVFSRARMKYFWTCQNLINLVSHIGRYFARIFHSSKPRPSERMQILPSLSSQYGLRNICLLSRQSSLTG